MIHREVSYSCNFITVLLYTLDIYYYVKKYYKKLNSTCQKNNVYLLLNYPILIFLILFYACLHSVTHNG